MTASTDYLGRLAAVLAPGRLLLLAALGAGIISMHGLTMPSMTGAGQHQMVAAVVSLAGPATAASPIVIMPAAEHGMPMPPSGGGHTGHDLLHTCVVVLTAVVGFAALALSAVALSGAAGVPGGLFIPGAGRGRGGYQRRHKPDCWSITQLCISRT